MRIRAFERSDTEAVVALWQRAGLTRPWNDPHKDIERKLQVQPELFLVAEDNGRLVGTAMAGYDGHRGWVNYLAVDGDCRGQGVGRALMERVREGLLALGCCKINLQIREDNLQAQAFYRRLGFAPDACVSMGLRLEAD